MKHWFGRCSQVSFIVVLTLCRVMNGAVAAPLPGGFEHSGWYQFELVVMVDARAEVLASETWPLTTSVHYPARWRWLQDPALKAALMAQYESAVVSVSPSGHTMVTLPKAMPPLWEPPPALLTEQEIALIDELMALRLPTPVEPESAAPDTDEPPALASADNTRGPLLPFEEAGLIEETVNLTPFESLGIADPDSRDSPPEVNILCVTRGASHTDPRHGHRATHSAAGDLRKTASQSPRSWPRTLPTAERRCGVVCHVLAAKS